MREPRERAEPPRAWEATSRSRRSTTSPRPTRPSSIACAATAQGSPVFRGSLLGDGWDDHRDRDPTGRHAGDGVQPSSGSTRQIQRIAREELAGLPDVQIWLVGSAHLKAETSRFLLRDLSLVIPLAFALIMLIALLSFRSLRGLLIPVSTIGDRDHSGPSP